MSCRRPAPLAASSARIPEPATVLARRPIAAPVPRSTECRIASHRPGRSGALMGLSRGFNRTCHAESLAVAVAAVQWAGAGHATGADQYRSHHHSRHAGRAEFRARRPVHGGRLCGLRGDADHPFVRAGRHLRCVVRARAGRDHRTRADPAVLRTPAGRPDPDDLWPGHRDRRSRAPVVRRHQPPHGGARLGQRHLQHGLHDLPQVSA